MGIFLEGNYNTRGIKGMKKVTKFLSLMVAAALTVTAFHGTDYSVGTVEAKGENSLDPKMLTINATNLLGDDANGQDVWYAFDLPQDGDLKVTVLGEVFIDKFTTDHDWISSWDNSTKNDPYLKHFSAAAGRHYLKLNTKDANAKVKIEFTGYGFKDSYEDEYEKPMTYVPGTEKVNVVSYADPIDWYKFEIPENGKYKISYIANTGQFKFYILNSDLKTRWSDVPVTGNELDTSTLYFLAGTYYIKIEADYSSKYKFTIDKQGINPTTIKKIKSKKKKQAEVKFKCVENVDGYQIRYSTKKDFSSQVKTKTITYTSYQRPKSMTATLKKLKRHKNYYVQVRTFEKSSSGDNYYSDWSKAKKVRVK